MKKTPAHELQNLSALPHFLDLCVERYDKAIEKIASDANITRLNVVDMSNYPSPCPLDQEEMEKTKRKTAQEEREKRLCAYAIVQVRLFVHSLGLEFVPTVDVALCSTVTEADADLGLRGENSTTVRLFVHKFRSEWWCVKADYIQDNENLWGHISLVLPWHVTPLRIVVGNDAEVDEGKVTIGYLLLRLSWDRGHYKRLRFGNAILLDSWLISFGHLEEERWRRDEPSEPQTPMWLNRSPTSQMCQTGMNQKTRTW